MTSVSTALRGGGILRSFNDAGVLPSLMLQSLSGRLF